jgi:hypothetical protein
MSVLAAIVRHCMNDSNASSSRVTLKLKGAARKSPDDKKAQPALRPQGKPSAKPGAHWSDEYKN